MILQSFQSYQIGSEQELTQAQVRQLIACFDRPSGNPAGKLGGRTAISTLDLSDIGLVVVKHYTRGGAIRRFNKEKYLHIGKTRSQAEFELLLELKKLGISAPEPVAFAVKGSLFYQAWIVTRKIADAAMLSVLSLNNPALASAAMPMIGLYVQRLIDNHILHVDLHPGNVMVDRCGRIYLIDFDKAKRTGLAAGKLKAKYASRWRRAVEKHHLPATIAELF